MSKNKATLLCGGTAELRAPSFSKQCTLFLLCAGSLLRVLCIFNLACGSCSGLSTIDAHFDHHVWKRSVLVVVGSILLFGNSHTDFFVFHQRHFWDEQVFAKH